MMGRKPRTLPQPEVNCPAKKAEQKPEANDTNCEPEKAVNDPKRSYSNVKRTTQMEYKKNEVGVGSVRRSQRKKKAAVVTATRDMHVIDDIIIGKSDEEEAGEEERNEAIPESVGGGGRLEEKVDSIFQLLEAQQKFIDVLNSKGFKRNFIAEGGAAGAKEDLNYKSLYFDSQKKVEALMEENHRLAVKLERARGQIEVGSLVSEVLDKLKDFIALSSLTKITDASLNLSAKAVRGTGVTQGTGLEGKSPPKRKRLGKAVN